MGRDQHKEKENIHHDLRQQHKVGVHLVEFSCLMRLPIFDLFEIRNDSHTTRVNQTCKHFFVLS